MRMATREREHARRAVGKSERHVHVHTLRVLQGIKEKNTGSERSRTNAVEIAFTAKSVRVSGVAAVVESVLMSRSVFVI